MLLDDILSELIILSKNEIVFFSCLRCDGHDVLSTNTHYTMSTMLCQIVYIIDIYQPIYQSANLPWNVPQYLRCLKLFSNWESENENEFWFWSVWSILYLCVMIDWFWFGGNHRHQKYQRFKTMLMATWFIIPATFSIIDVRDNFVKNITDFFFMLIVWEMR